jgi:Fe-Mn family superoxide dismutase
MNTLTPLNESLSRRDALKTLTAGAALLGLGLWGDADLARAAGTDATAAGSPVFTLPKLPYAYDALEPHIDAKTMEIHYTKHHQAYITNANKALESLPALRGLSGEALLKKLSEAPEAVRTTLRNNVGGHVNHSFFWQIIGPNAGGEPKGALAAAITSGFGKFETFQAEFADAGAKRFGSGWAWLVYGKGKLSVTSTANQDSPLLEGSIPIVGLDVWEHAYYLKYQNLRPQYIKAFWNVVNWDRAETHYQAAMKA